MAAPTAADSIELIQNLPRNVTPQDSKEEKMPEKCPSGGPASAVRRAA
jgi:hypothetical protein